MTDYEKYLRLDRFPLASRPGCGEGIVVKAILRAVDRVGLKGDEICLVSGISAPGLALDFLAVNTLDAATGQALPVAVRAKIARPDMNVIVVEQDDGATPMGGKPLVDAARRNLDITIVLLSPWIHGTPGRIGPRVDVAALAADAGANFVARETVAKPLAVDKLVERALRKQGFSLVEVVTPFPTGDPRDAAAMIRALEEHSVPRGCLARLGDEKRAGAIVTGVFVDASTREYPAD